MFDNERHTTASEPITEVWVGVSSEGPGAEPLVQVERQRPLKLKAFRQFSYKEEAKS